MRKECFLAYFSRLWRQSVSSIHLSPVWVCVCVYSGVFVCMFLFTLSVTIQVCEATYGGIILDSSWLCEFLLM